jgi:YNFM family putative membrane transporter
VYEKMSQSSISRDNIQKAEKGERRYQFIKWTVALSGIAVYAQLYDFQALLSQIAGSFHKTPAQSSLTVSAATFGMAFGLFVYAFIADNFSRKRVLAASLLAISVLTVIMSFAGNFDVLVGLNFLKGVGSSGAAAVTLAYLSEEILANSLGVAISFYLAGNTFGGMFGRVSAGFLGGWLNWETAILSIGLLGLVLGLIFLKYFPKSNFFHPEKTSVKYKVNQMKEKLTSLNLLGIYLIAFCLMGSFVSMYNYIGFHLESAPYSLPHYLIASIFLLYIFGIIGNMLAGYLSDRYSTKKIFRVTLILLLAGLGLMLFSSLSLILVGLILFTLTFFLIHTLAGRLVTELTVEGKSMATSLYWLFYYVGSSVIGTSSGVFVNGGNWNYFIITLLVLGFISLLAGFYSTRKLA